ncbi:16S rRNA (cytosine(967)-C(5))-methyltransferase RsmB [Sneathiella limimaris]|uniref:16S rRNA (cytosine(967)-C(5))-methyltransferase RsmB n=1 Tax=Sneathiella limimaris TaxID=1964213 RepID=UPI00146B57C0|nr:16S rRNA (cytosine(967)-C(5))-methyltransferase RsmB [Sneathiella limimaris]
MTDKKPNARLRAVTMLAQVLDKNQLLEDILFENLKGLSDRDRSLARALVSTTLRHLGIIDALIDKMLDRPLPKSVKNIRHILRVGITQILFMDIAVHAAIHDTVELVPANSKFRGLVNALLRRTDRQGQKLLTKMNQSKANLPAWLWKSWSEFYGVELTQQISDALRKEAPLDITLKSNEDPEEVKQWAEKLEAIILPGEQLRRSAGGSVTSLAGFQDGDWWIQDYSASLPVRLFGNIKGKRALDLCAAPGGKTAQLIAKGAEVTALDRSKARLRRLEENLERLSFNATIVVSDAATFKPEELFDIILLDAPCSSTGTIRRHPDVAWLKTQEDVKKLAELQERLLDATISQLKSGGTLVYSTCSLQPEEGEWQIAKFLEKHPEMKRNAITPKELNGLEDVVTKEGDLRCLPCHLDGLSENGLGGMDGFFAARLVKD